LNKAELISVAIKNIEKIRLDAFFENKFQNLVHKKFIYFFFLINCILIFLTFNHPIGDFGNYYYGSKLFLQGANPLRFYQDIHFFNTEIRDFERGVFFENYVPVPPFSLLFYLPFTFLKLSIAKLVFNLFSLFIFCFSLNRLIRELKFFNVWFYFLPLIFLQPLFSNFHHGQTYLLVTALLFEFYIAFNKHKNVRIGWIITLLFALKIFPAFIAIMLIFKKEWKAIRWILIFSTLLGFTCYFTIGFETLNYYYLKVLPRLVSNDITAPFYFFNQSFYTFLLNAFVQHPFLNLSPIINAPIIAVVIQLLFYALVFSFYMKIVLGQNLFISFFVTLLVLFLLNKYSTVYGLIVLFPFIFLFKDLPAKAIFIISILVFIINNIPIYKLSDFPLLLQYPRVWMLMVIFILLVVMLKPGFNLKYFMVCLLIFTLPSLAFLKYVSDGAIEIRPKTGIVYDFEVLNDRIKFYTCLGNRDSVEYYNFVAQSIDTTKLERIKNKFLPANKAVVANKNTLIYMADDFNGVGMYYLKLRTIKPKQ